MPPTLPPPIVYPPTYPSHHQNFSSYTNYPHAYEYFNRPSGCHSSEFAPEERPVKRHHRMPLGTTNEQQERRGRRRQRVDFSSSSDGGRFNLKSQRQNNNTNHHCKKRREKLNLVGKTGVSALHEWCVHCKKQPPNFVLLPSRPDFFCFAAYVDDLEWSRGRGATKASAKQDAARKALQALVPGVIFDDSGLVTDMTANEAIEDLPNLAERLAIDATKKRRCDVYPGTSTTTDDDGEDENAYYANRGASVCSALLHAMWQINDDIPEPPSYSYDVPSSSTNSIKDGSRPSSFSCTATICLRVREATQGSEYEAKESNADEDELDTKPKAKRKGCVDNESSDPTPSRNNAITGDLSSTVTTKVKVLTGVGIGATKREARHVASAKLLSLLFPDCEGMVEVKACAEAARERYAASKALKQQTKRFGGPSKQVRHGGSFL
ncbi:Double-stranded RNA binding motif [Fragilaria crotonensis]|nr:Double-stranded RNA binding motif [Fragilaria crotonensis]